MFELKLEAYDKYEAVYTWGPFNVVGRTYSSGEYSFYFPEIDTIKAMKSDFEHILRKYNIPTFGEDIHTFFKKTAKDELEKVLNKAMGNSLNRKVLLMGVFDEVIISSKK